MAEFLHREIFFPDSPGIFINSTSFDSSPYIPSLHREKRSLCETASVPKVRYEDSHKRFYRTERCHPNFRLDKGRTGGSHDSSLTFLPLISRPKVSNQQEKNKSISPFLQRRKFDPHNKISLKSSRRIMKRNSNAARASCLLK